MESTPQIQRILVAHDFSETADCALAYAIGMAEKFGARITVLHVCDVLAYGVPDAMVASLDWTGEAEQAASDTLVGIVEQAGRTSNRVIEGVLRRGLAWEAISALSLEIGADLVVMGTHGRRGFARAALGSVAEKMVRMSSCPVLTVHLPQAQQALVAHASSASEPRP